MNKLVVLVTGLLLTLSVPLCAQPHDRMEPPREKPRKPGDRPFNPEEFRKNFEKYIIQKAGLLPSEAQRFFPLFHELRQQQRSVQGKIRKALSRIDKEKLSDSDCERILAEIHRLQKQHNNLEIKYNEKFKKALPARKLLKVIKAEREFGRDMFRKGPRR